MENEPFLYGPLRKETSIGFSAQYEWLHDLWGRLEYWYSDITDEDAARTPDYLLGRKNSFAITIWYGM